MKRIAIYITAIAIAYLIVYCAVRSAVNDEVALLIRETIRNEFIYQESMGNVFCNDC